MKYLSGKDLVVIGALSAVVGLAIPLQTYFGNASIYPFSAARLIPELLAFAFAIAAILSLVQILCRLVRVSAIPLFAALTVCAYLESGILSLGLPELNGGEVRELSDAVRAVVDGSVWLVLVAGFILASRWLKNIFPLISLAVGLLAFLAILDARAPVAATDSSLAAAPSFQSQPTIVANVRYSPARNILMFILDSLPGTDAADVMRADPELAKAFDGFIAYPKNIGMHSCTKRGVPALVTGRHYDPAEISEAEFPMTMYATNSFVKVAEASGWNVAFSPDLLPYGLTNLPIEKRIVREESRRSRDALALLRQSTEVPNLSLFDVISFRLSPFVWKGPILYARIRHAVKGRHESDRFWTETVQYAQLAERPLNTSTNTFLGVFHTWGVHPPWQGTLASVAREKLVALGTLMNAYRAKGIYDQSMIIVTSDHALDIAKTVGKYPPSASAILWVKSVGSRGVFAESETQTSHARIAPLVRAELAAPQSRAQVEEILTDPHPLYRAKIREGGRSFFKDWKDN